MSAIFFTDNIKEKDILLPNCSRFAPRGQSYYLSCDDRDHLLLRLVTFS